MGFPIPTFPTRALCAALGCISLLVSSTSFAQTCRAEIAGGKRLESPQYVVAYRTAPAPVPMGRHFTVDIAVCPRAGAAPPERVSLDARMPEHGHGMNYKALVKPAGAGRFHAEGLMFHMPGRWELTFDVHEGASAVRLTDSIVLR